VRPVHPRNVHEPSGSTGTAVHSSLLCSLLPAGSGSITLTFDLSGLRRNHLRALRHLHRPRPGPQ
jgi:hypothetical protein